VNETEKHELLEIFNTALARHSACACPNGIDAATARELADFAEAWKHARKTVLVAFFGALVTSALAALFAGIKSMLS